MCECMCVYTCVLECLCVCLYKGNACTRMHACTHKTMYTHTYVSLLIEHWLQSVIYTNLALLDSSYLQRLAVYPFFLFPPTYSTTPSPLLSWIYHLSQSSSLLFFVNDLLFDIGQTFYPPTPLFLSCALQALRGPCKVIKCAIWFIYMCGRTHSVFPHPLF